MKETLGVIFEMEAVSPEVRMANEMAQFQQLAAYRARKLQAYKDWADPVKREARIAEQKKLEVAAKAILPTLPDQDWVRTGKSPIKVKDV